MGVIRVTEATVAALVLAMVLVNQVDGVTQQVCSQWDSTNPAVPPHLNITNPVVTYGYQTQVIPCTYYGFGDTQDFNQSVIQSCLATTWTFVRNGNVGTTNTEFVYYYVKPGWYNATLNVYACYIGCFNLFSPPPAPTPAPAPTPSAPPPSPPRASSPPLQSTAPPSPSVLSGSQSKAKKSSSMAVAAGAAGGVGALLILTVSFIALWRLKIRKTTAKSKSSDESAFSF